MTEQKAPAGSTVLIELSFNSTEPAAKAFLQ
jgi:hypothetical protein